MVIVKNEVVVVVVVVVVDGYHQTRKGALGSVLLLD